MSATTVDAAQSRPARRDGPVLGVEFTSHLAPFRTPEVAEALLRALDAHPTLSLDVRTDPGGFAPQLASPEAKATTGIDVLFQHPRVSVVDAGTDAGALDAWLTDVDGLLVPALTSTFEELHAVAVACGVPVLAPETAPSSLDVLPHFVADLTTSRTTPGAFLAVVEHWLRTLDGES